MLKSCSEEKNMKYFNTIDKKLLEYYKILSPNIPDFLNDYINTPELMRQKYISVSCGRIYSKSFPSDIFYSSLDHSIGVTLIIWNFTKDKKQTLSGLFHDIATPVFKHSIDFLNGDYMKQESTESLTKTIIENSKEIKGLLDRDKIKLEEVCDYHIYPIADNDTPKLSSDRLEYSLSNSIIYGISDLDEVYRLYKDIYISRNEDDIEELAFKHRPLATRFVEITSKLSVCYRDDITRYSMQLLADIVKKLNEDGLITKEDLYTKKESEIVDIIEKSKYGKYFDIWKNADEVKTSKEKPSNVYYVHHDAKIRYVDPLVKICSGSTRVSRISKEADEIIKKNLAYDMDNYVYLDFKLD